MGWFRKEEPRLVLEEQTTSWASGPVTVDSQGGGVTGGSSLADGSGGLGDGWESWSTQTTDADQMWGTTRQVWAVDDHPTGEGWTR